MPALRRTTSKEPTVLSNKPAADLESAVLDVLRESQEGTKFQDIEKRVTTRFKGLRSPYEIRKATWRLIGANRAKVTTGMRVRVP